MISFYSKHNQVYPVVYAGRKAVKKLFQNREDWQREREIYETLPLPHPELMAAGPGWLVTAYCPFPNLLEVLEDQERKGFSPEPWNALAQWLTECSVLTGSLPGEGNLRNFLWDAEKNQVLGFDFECYRPSALSSCGALIIAALLEYDPVDTAAKRQVGEVLSKGLEVPETEIVSARQLLQSKRKARPLKPISGIILAGGRSRRMGRNKANLYLKGKTLLELQVEKMRFLGIDDILLSGAGCAPLPGVRIIPDELPDRGPLGGLHACLRTAVHPQCLVLSVDAPLVPASALSQLRRCHEKGVTVLSHNEKQEPLMGIYDRTVAEKIAVLITERGVPVQVLRSQVEWNTWEYAGPEELLLNCNTPEDYAQLQQIAKKYG